MSELPDDPKHWPTDPFVLLNIGPAPNARAAKRAYYKLVRKYKPDRFPVEFQKIREAYEQVERWLTWNVPTDDDTGAPGSELGSASNPEGLAGNGDEDQVPTPNADSGGYQFSDDEISRVSLSANQPDLFDQFHESLKSGEIATAVSFIDQVGPSDGPAQTARANLTKYYLARFLPGPQNPLDTATTSDIDQKRIAALVQSLESSERYQSAYAELRFEFDRDHQLANCEAVNRFLNAHQNPQTLVELMRLRWEAIGHYDRQMVIDDWESLKPRALEFDGQSSGWIDLMAESMKYTVWHTDPRCIQHNRECWREISQSQRSWTADAVELLIFAAEEWKTMREFFEWSAALPWARNSLPETSRRIWMPVAKTIASDRTKSLWKLNQLFQNYSIAMSVFEEGLGQLVTNCADNDAAWHNVGWDETRDTVACFFHKHRQADYVLSREMVLDFCVLNQIPPLNFAHAANTFLGPEATVSWSELVSKDGPLLCVYYACLATSI